MMDELVDMVGSEEKLFKKKSLELYLIGKLKKSMIGLRGTTHES